MNYRITGTHSFGDKDVKVFPTEIANEEAALAFIFLEKWGPVCTAPDGEDSAGRAKWRPLTPEEVVSKAFEIARCAMELARARGLMVNLPDLNELNAERDKEKVEAEA